MKILYARLRLQEHLIGFWTNSESSSIVPCKISALPTNTGKMWT